MFTFKSNNNWKKTKKKTSHLHFSWQPNACIMKHSAPTLYRLAASTVHQLQRNMLKHLRKTSLNHRNLPWTGGHLNAWKQLQQFYCLSRADVSPPPSSFYWAALHFWVQVFNNLAGSEPDANERRWSSQQLEWSAWVEMADYTVLQAKRMIAVICLPNRKISYECVENRSRILVHSPRMCTFAVCASPPPG